MSADEKKILRAHMKDQRALSLKQNPHAGKDLANIFFQHFDFSNELIIGGYWPIGSELDLRPLLKQLYEKDHTCALPCIEGNEMTFHLWNPETKLKQKKYRTLEPPIDAEIVSPDILLVPLLAFDRKGHRLGYGKGFYDRYLEKHTALTIGIAFQEQEVQQIPRQFHDHALNMILTNKELIKALPS